MALETAAAAVLAQSFDPLPVAVVSLVVGIIIGLYLRHAR